MLMYPPATWLLDNPLRLAGIFLIAFGVAFTSFCLTKTRERTQPISDKFLVRSLIRHPMSRSGEPVNPSRTISFSIGGEGRVFGTIESSDETPLKLGVTRQTISSSDVTVFDHFIYTAKGSFDFRGLRQGDYEMTIQSTDQKPRQAQIDCTVSDKTKPYEKYLALSVAIITSGVVVLMKGF